MAPLSWDVVGERYFELGCDRGVLYVGSDPGVSWTGLISVIESPTGGEARPYYIDGKKYLNLSSSEEFAAAINAFSAPRQFGPCDGTAQIQNGLYATQQPRRQFGLSYRTAIGNDVQGQEHGYKIHLVYNALAAPSSRSNNTLGDSIEPIEFGWNLTTLAPAMTGLKPTAHLIIDTRYTDPDILIEVEGLLYGNESGSASLPTPDDLVAIFTP